MERKSSKSDRTENDVHFGGKKFRQFYLHGTLMAKAEAEIQTRALNYFRIVVLTYLPTLKSFKLFAIAFARLCQACLVHCAVLGLLQVFLMNPMKNPPMEKDLSLILFLEMSLQINSTGASILD